MPNVYVHDNGFNLYEGVQKSQFDALKSKVDTLEANYTKKSGNGKKILFTSPNGFDVKNEQLIGQNKAYTMWGSMTAIVDEGYHTMTIRGTNVIAAYPNNPESYAEDTVYWGLHLPVLHDQDHFNMPMFTQKYQNGGYSWNNNARAANERWYLDYPEWTFVRTGSPDSRWFGRVIYFDLTKTVPYSNPRPNAEHPEEYQGETGVYCRILNNDMGCFKRVTKTESDGEHKWLVPASVKHDGNTHQFNAYDLKDLGNILKDANGYTGTGNLAGGLTMEFEVTLNIIKPKGDDF